MKCPKNAFLSFALKRQLKLLVVVIVVREDAHASRPHAVPPELAYVGATSATVVSVVVLQLCIHTSSHLGFCFVVIHVVVPAMHSAGAQTMIPAVP